MPRRSGGIVLVSKHVPQHALHARKNAEQAQKERKRIERRIPAANAESRRCASPSTDSRIIQP